MPVSRGVTWGITCQWGTTGLPSSEGDGCKAQVHLASSHDEDTLHCRRGCSSRFLRLAEASFSPE